MLNEIHPTAIIDSRVKLGSGNKILPYTIILGPTEIGDDNIIGPHVVIGSPGQDTRNPRYESSDCLIKIGNRNIIREFSAIQKPCYKEITQLGDDIYIMQSVHIPHDAIIENKVVITPMCVLAGITRILEGANLGMGSSLNQYCIIGQYSIVATGAPVMKNVKPFSRYIPNKPISVNEYAIKKYNFEIFHDEIENYVLKDSPVFSPEIKKIIDHFNTLHLHSKRELYL